MPPRRTLSRKVRQTRLQLYPLAPSSASEENPPGWKGKIANVRYGDAQRGGAKGVGNGDVPSESLPTPEPSSQIPPEIILDVSSPLSDPPSSLLSSPSPNALSSKKQKEQRKISSASHSSPSSQDLQTPIRKSTRFLQPHSPDSQPSGRSSTRLRNRQSRPDTKSAIITQTRSRLNSSQPQLLSDIGSPETSGDEDNVVSTLPARRRRQTKIVPEDDFVVDDDKVTYISSDEEPLKDRSGKRKMSTRDDFVVDNDVVEYISSDEDIRARSSKARRLSKTQKSPRTLRRESRKERQELKEDLLDLQDSDTPKRTSRTRGGPVTTQRDKDKKSLDILRRRRAGEKVPRDDEEEDEDDEAFDSSNLEFMGRDLDRYDMTVEASDDSSTGMEGQEVSDGNEEEDEFIENDSPSRRRRPHPDIPLEFTSYASAKPKTLFVNIMDWLVKNKIAPAFSREDEIFKLAFGRVDDQVRAQAGSRLISSAWNSTFKDAILARPGMKIVALPGEDEDLVRSCDACNKSNHPARYDFTFSGHAYSKDTLEPIDNESDSEGDSSSAEEDDGVSKSSTSSKISHDAAGHPLAPLSQHFFLGRFCAANAEMGHKLSHWKYQLNTSVMSYLEDQGVLSADAIIAREKLSKKKREREAEKIVDMMEDTFMVDKLWKDFQNDLEDARMGMVGFEKKGGRSRGRVGKVWQGEQGEIY